MRRKKPSDDAEVCPLLQFPASYFSVHNEESGLVASTHALKLSKVDVEHARPSSLDLSSSGVSLFREEHIFLFHLGHDIRMSFDLFVPNVSAVDCFNYSKQVRRRTLKGDHCVSRLHSGNSPSSLHS
jgi:hypothetical protein